MRSPEGQPARRNPWLAGRGAAGIFAHVTGGEEAMQDVEMREVSLEAVVAEVKALRAEIQLLAGDVRTLEREVRVRLNALERELGARLQTVERETNARHRALEECYEGLKHEVRTLLEIRERLAALEARLAS